MFSIENFPQILEHIKYISPNMFQEKNNEIVIFCPFCDDAFRRSGHLNHGHCYIAKDIPVFNCFRCSESGSLSKFLIYTGFRNFQLVKQLNQNLKYKSTKYKINQFQPFNIIEYIDNFKKHYTNEYKKFLTFIRDRVGNIEYSNFLIYPSINDKDIMCNFMNYNGSTIVSRNIDYKKYRKLSNGGYYFQDLQGLESNIVVCEGPFDIINMFLFNNIFENSWYIAACGPISISFIEKLIVEEFLIGKFRINIIFDSDVKMKEKKLNRIKSMTKIYNSELEIFGWTPLHGKDVGVYPIITPL